MGRGKKSRKPLPSPRPWRATRPAALGLVTLVVAVGALVGLGWLGNEALRWIGPRDRYRARVADIECDSPPDTTRQTFLAEVRYVGNLPETFNTLDPTDRDQVSAAFAAHPWVKTAPELHVEPGNVVRARLSFRAPVLVVNVEGTSPRLVDTSGVLLPVATAPPGIAELVSPVAEPKSPAGQVWADETVQRAVELVKAYQPTRLEKSPSGWRLTQPGGNILVVR